MNVGDQVQITGKITEIVENEDFGKKVTVKIKANDKLVTLTFDDSEIGGNTTNP